MDKISFADKEGNIYSNYSLITSKHTEFGVMHICNNEIIYEFKSKNKDYFDRFIENIEVINEEILKYSMAKDFEKYLPKVKQTFEDRYGDFIIILEKEPDILNLADVLSFEEQVEEIPEKQKIWIINRLFNLICLLNYLGLSHNGITLNNCYVSFSMHSLYLFGGWQYSTKLNEWIKSCPKVVFSNLPTSVITSGKATTQVDISCLQNIGKVLFKTSTTKAFFKFFNTLDCSEPIYDLYIKWESLTFSIYERKFEEWELTHFDIY